MPQLTEADLAYLTPDELEALRLRTAQEIAGLSPLDCLCVMYPETRRWRHLELLNDNLVALFEYRLTARGPVPAGEVRWWYEDYAQPGVEREVSTANEIPEDVAAFGAYAVLDGEREPIVFQLSVSLRPRAGKSHLIVEALPVWLLLKDPGIHIGVATYSDDFAKEWGGKVRDKLLAMHRDDQRPMPFLPYPAGGERSAKELFEPKGGSGKLRFVGVGGGINGKSLTVLIADDLIKNDVEAQSAAVRQAAKDFYDSTWSTRKTRDLRKDAKFPIPVEVLMGTRWHNDDVIAYATEEPETHRQREGWRVINIPAIAESSDDPLGRRPGQAHPSAGGESAAELEKRRRANPRVFAALYQGHPTLAGGGMIPSTVETFDRIPAGGGYPVRYVWHDSRGRHVVAHDELIIFATADTAATKKSSADWTVVAICGYSRAEDTVLVLDWYRDRITTTEYLDELLPLLRRYEVKTIRLEDITYGRVLSEKLREVKPPIVSDFAKQGADKVSRVSAAGLGPRIKTGRLRFPEGALWVPICEHELGAFPFDAHDDQVDVLAFACEQADSIPPETTPRPRPTGKTLDEIAEEHFQAASKPPPRGSHVRQMLHNNLRGGRSR